jgi:hypothetical protein
MHERIYIFSFLVLKMHVLYELSVGGGGFFLLHIRYI